jgi:Flp pilus assembly protein TadD
VWTAPCLVLPLSRAAGLTSGMWRGRFAEAEALCRHALKKDPGNGEAGLWLGYAAEGAGR